MFDYVVESMAGMVVWYSDLHPELDYIGYIDIHGEEHLYED